MILARNNDFKMTKLMDYLSIARFFYDSCISDVETPITHKVEINLKRFSLTMSHYSFISQAPNDLLVFNRFSHSFSLIYLPLIIFNLNLLIHNFFFGCHHFSPSTSNVNARGKILWEFKVESRLKKEREEA